MTSKEIIKRIIAHDAPPRIGYSFTTNTDFKGVRNRQLINLPENPYDAWGTYPELSELTGFRGETRRDFYGNIYGRFDGKTKGECIRGAIQDLEDYEFNFPDFDPNFREKLLEMKLAENEKFIITTGTAIFSILRDARLISNALMDTIECPELVAEFIDKIVDHEIKVIKSIEGCGIDGWIIYDDLGTQISTFFSPATFREIFKPAYKKLADAVH